MYSERLRQLEEAKKHVDNGKLNCIPFYEAYPRLSKYLPGIVKGTYYIVSANSGIGKTQLAKHMFVLTPYRFIKNNPDCGLKLKILYFALEESREEFIDSLIVAHLFEKYGISIDTLQLRSMYKNSLSQDILDKLKECQEYFNDLFNCVEVIDSVSNPTGIYKYCRDYSEQHGKHIHTTREFTEKDSFGNEKKTNERVYSHYEPNDPNEYVIVLTDHISLLGEESGMNKHQTMSKWSVDYCRKQITKHWKYIVVNIQQQSSESEKQQFTISGKSIESKLEPSLDGLGDNKMTQRDALVVLGLFAPDRYGIEVHNGYNIKVLKDNYRQLSILKNRIGRSNLKIPLYFKGESNHFEELPPVEEFIQNPLLYNKYKGG